MKIGLLTDKTIPEFKVQALKKILEDESYEIKMALIDGRPQKSIFQKIKHNLRKGRGGYIIIMFLNKFFERTSSDSNTKKICHQYGIDIIETKYPYSLKTIETIQSYGLDILILIGGYGIVRKKLLKSVPLGVLSYHHGNMRKYRGMPPALWELYNNEKEMGITVQILSPGLDNGIPIEEKTIKINRKDSVQTLEKRAYNESTDMLYSALKKLSNKTFEPIPIENFGEVYTLPNLRQWLVLKLRIAWRKMN